MKLPIYQVDAFAKKAFEGNPAAVVPLEKWLDSGIMQNIAMENNLSETAFFVRSDKGFQIRWFTPQVEVDLCGHATLAAAHVLFNHLNYRESEISFQSRSGVLKVGKAEDLIVLNFPSSELVETEVAENLAKAFNYKPLQSWKGRDDIMLVFENEVQIEQLVPDFGQILKSEIRGVITTASSLKYDFVSRFFAPAVGVNEDPVTGSAHTMLVPYWAEKLGKAELVAKQVSDRGGVLYCKNLGERVEIAGKAVTYLIGEINV